MIFKVLLIYELCLVLTKVSIFLFGQRLQLSEILFLFLFGFWLKDLIKNKRFIQDAGLNKPFLLFIGFCLLSFFNSSNIFLSTTELLGLIYLFITLILVVDIVNDRRKLDIIIKLWLGILATVLVLGLIAWVSSIVTGNTNSFCEWSYRGNFPYIKNRTVYRVNSIFHNPIALANYIVISLGLVVSELLLAENKRYKFFLKILIFFMCLIMLATVSREILGFMVVFFLIYNFYKVKDLRFKIIRFLSASLIIILFLCITIFCSSFHILSSKVENVSKEDHKELVVNIDYAYDAKLIHKIAALEMFSRHPFLGVGLKMYRPYLDKLNNENYFSLKNLVPILYYSRGVGSTNHPIVNDPHNDILQYFAETGIFGGSSFIFFIAVFLYLICINLKKIDDRYFKVRLFCFSASFIGMLVESIDLDVFKVRPVWFLMALILAVIRIGSYEKNKGSSYNY